jgi:hypothetical protein
MRAVPDQSRKWLAAAALIGLTIAAAGAEHLGAFRTVRPWLLDLCSPGRLMVLALSPFEPAEAAKTTAAETSISNSVAASSGSGSSATSYCCDSY